VSCFFSYFFEWSSFNDFFSVKDCQSLNRHDSGENSEKTDSISPSNTNTLEQSLECELDEENIRFDDNDDDAGIEYLDENFNEPLSSLKVGGPTEYNYLKMLKDRPDILDSFLMKPKESDAEDEELDECAENLNEDVVRQDSQIEGVLEENSQDYFENYEYHCQADHESFEDEFYGNYLQ
jgi:hypothetical protein